MLGIINVMKKNSEVGKGGRESEDKFIFRDSGQGRCF